MFFEDHLVLDLDLLQRVNPYDFTFTHILRPKTKQKETQENICRDGTHEVLFAVQLIQPLYGSYSEFDMIGPCI